MARGKVLQIRLSDEEYDGLCLEAGEEGISVYARRVLLNRQEIEEFREPITIEYHEQPSRPLYGDKLISDNRPLLNTEEEKQRKMSIAVEALIETAPEIDVPIF